MAEDFTNPFLEDDDEEVAATPAATLPSLPPVIQPVEGSAAQDDVIPWPEAEPTVPLTDDEWQPTQPPEDEAWDFSFADDDIIPVPDLGGTGIDVLPEETSPQLPPVIADEAEDWGFFDSDTGSNEPQGQDGLDVLDDFVGQNSNPVVQDSTQVEEDWGFGPEIDNAAGEQVSEIEEDWGFSFADDEAPLPIDANPADQAFGQGDFADEFDEDFGPPTGGPEPDDELAPPGEDDTGPDDDWGFFTEVPEEDIPVEEWGFSDELADEVPEPSDEGPEEEEAPEDALDDFMSDPEPPVVQDDGDEAEEDEPDESGGLKARLAALWAQIRSELRGGDETPPPVQNDDDGPGARAGGFLGKIFYPYTWLVGKVLGLLLLILGPLRRIPFLAPLIVANKFFKILAFALPILIVCAILQWQGSKALPLPNDLTFPDGGKAGLQDFGYDSKTQEAYATVVNKGDVIAEVTPTLEVYSLQFGLNPLSFFFAKPNAKCVGEEVTVQIDGKEQVRVKCPIDGPAKKVTGDLEW